MWSSGTIVTVKILLKLELQNWLRYFSLSYVHTETAGLATPTAQSKAGVGCMGRRAGGVWPSLKRLKSVSLTARSCFAPDCLGGGESLVNFQQSWASATFNSGSRYFCRCWERVSTLDTIWEVLFSQTPARPSVTSARQANPSSRTLWEYPISAVHRVLVPAGPPRPPTAERCGQPVREIQSCGSPDPQSQSTKTTV